MSAFSKPVTVGSRAPSFTLRSAGGRDISLEDYRNQKHLRQLGEQYQEFLAAGAEVVAIVGDSVEAARSYFEKNRLPFPCLADPNHEIYDRYRVETKMLSLGQRPGLFILDRHGIVRYAHVGSQQWEIPGNAQVLEVCRGLPCTASA